jgi:hypothetical protein
LHAAQDTVIADFNADGLHVFGMLQVRKQRTITTTQIQYTTVWLNPLRNPRQISAQIPLHRLAT